MEFLLGNALETATKRGQNEAEIVLQSPNRVTGMILFFIIISIAQTLFVIKKKQWEKVQASEMNF